jgi:cellulose synthase (UDP-forming)
MILGITWSIYRFAIGQLETPWVYLINTLWGIYILSLLWAIISAAVWQPQDLHKTEVK